ncbi:dihydrolipoyl dehydrogenase [Candidatus Uhrbacteria bacterium CG_4_10_14_0_2_um_filter_41_7]|uniref:Dihydrolipoyl dehydrogenase n=1 Tax=Candidatus Uhrbacteria bacterium CG_4_9_14_3_um_filter_41_35 TaxID=1975034 RepID=A0A2M7XFV6_9BACT|nr:MAG: dihydrolipoyl dehydrogenase [Candidatus Uhrbacteria bacterium CG11_big_fil_rev_8_21_14_0_20_41_9]PIZ54017.1 MAG: dihydrolipoyl dehydrogenase [Candidatus Uhrbacteria bacterium CG_4_10_14_0_2_um_filter_41_7]PJA46616.1 MAG: dihydrolipoyl dehydrogenase [Candidatus Uhrbacteria bacterium CG_4_9_14_3_um_filter_41_35]
MKRGKNKFDVIVIGSGSAGFSAAETAQARGAKVLVIESGDWGGECPNSACIPTKALLKSAKRYREVTKNLEDFGISAGSVGFSFANIMAEKNKIVDLITSHGQKIPRLAKEFGIQTVKGKAVFLDQNTIVVEKKKYTAKAFVIATGAIDFIPPIAGLTELGFISYKDIMKMKKLPKSIAIIGGGAVSCEFATFFSTFGVKVHILQLDPTILIREDVEIANLATHELMKNGVEVYVDTKTLSVEKYGRRKRVTFDEGKHQREHIIVDEVMVAAGKRANVSELKLENAKVKVDDRGRLKVTEDLQTSAKHIFTAGDVSGGFLFTHTARTEGAIAGNNVVNFLEKQKSRLKRDMRVVPRVTFTNPEVASVGITSDTAGMLKKEVLIGRFPIGALGRAVTERDRRGLVKIIVDKKTRKILGGHIIGERAGELIHEIAFAMEVDCRVDVLANMIHAYPSYSEAIAGAASSLE